MATRKRSIKREGSVRLWGAPNVGEFVKSPPGEYLDKASSLHFTSRKDKNRLLALERLAIDVLNDPNAARAFAVNPDAYLKAAGFPGVQLDLNSQEVRVAMALGDPDVRAAARTGDVDRFVDGILAQGVRLGTNNGIGIFIAFAAAEVGAYFTAVVHSWAVATAVAETVAAVHHAVATKVKVSGIGTAQNQHDMVLALARRLGDEKFIKAVESTKTKRIIENYVQFHEEFRKTLK